MDYYRLGGHKKLNEIVFAGSHDAGITGGGSNIQTQHLHIGDQAAAGVRLFDLRVAATVMRGQHGGAKQVELKSFHADSKLMKNEQKSRFVPEVNRTETVTRTKLRGGAFGDSLIRMLWEARTFVKINDTEFLILKFDKCTNWPLIAEICVSELDDVLYKGAGNLNTTTLEALKGKVVCLFIDEALAVIPHQYRMGGGILGIRNLHEGGSYSANYNGLQYFGKGGTSIVRPWGKLAENEKKQGKLMAKAKAKANADASNANVMGMMYWTTTGVSESIRNRNAGMWSAPNRQRLKALWQNGLGDSINVRLPSNVDAQSHSAGSFLKRFMPNIVMIDFASPDKCEEIFALNRLTPTELTATVREVA
jgi:hypothetical protein